MQIDTRTLRFDLAEALSLCFDLTVALSLRFDLAVALSLRFHLGESSPLWFDLAMALSLNSIRKSGESGGCRKLPRKSSKRNLLVAKPG
jgi:hypothetical protein